VGRDQVGPGRGKGDDHACGTRQHPGGAAQREEPVGSQAHRFKGRAIFAADDEHVDEEEHHREAPDHHNRRLGEDADHRGEVGGGHAQRQRVGQDDEEQERERGGDPTLHQHSDSRDATAVEPAHESWQAPIQPADEDQAGERVVVDRGGKDEEPDEHQCHQEAERRSEGTETGAHGLSNGRRAALGAEGTRFLPRPCSISRFITPR